MLGGRAEPRAHVGAAADALRASRRRQPGPRARGIPARQRHPGRARRYPPARDGARRCGWRARFPCSRVATPLIGHFQIRNRGTVGGSLAHADPASEYPRGRGRARRRARAGRRGRPSRLVAADDFFVGTWTTSAEPDELLVAARFPVWPRSGGFAVEEVARRHGDFAIAGVACAVERTDGAGSALFGVGRHPVRAARRGGGAARRGTRRPTWPRPPSATLLQPADVHAGATTRLRIGAAISSNGRVTRALGRTNVIAR